MKKIYLRELRHICANFKVAKRPTGYCKCIDSQICKAIKKMIKWEWLKVVSIIDKYVFVEPADKINL